MAININQRSKFTGVFKLILFLTILLISTAKIYGQEVFENAPPNMRWHQINTPHFKIIFPANFEMKAQDVANHLESIYVPASETLDAQPRKISVILQNREAVSNGFVSLAPRRSEFFTMPPQDYNFLGTNDWLKLLATHEYRHVVQFQKSLTGWNRLFYYIFGQNAQAGLAYVSVPQWFWEGDATLTETLLTSSGRGRIRAFDRLYRTNLIEGNDYKYVKQYLGSYKDMVPNDYVLGYHFSTYLRKSTNDPKIWEKVTKDAFSWPFIPFTFSNSLKRNTSLNLKKNYRRMQDDLKGFWSEQQKILQSNLYDPINAEGKIFTNYNHPQLLDSGVLVVMKEGLGDVKQLTFFNDKGQEIEYYIPGMVNESGLLSAAGTKVVWNEIFDDIRWRKASSSVIKIYDFETKKAKTLTKGTRYAGADLSPDGTKVITTLVTEDQQFFLVVLDAISGKELSRFSFPDNGYPSMARFSNDGNKIVTLVNKDGKKGIFTIDYPSGDKNILIPFGNENVGHPVMAGEWLFYNSPFNGIDNIYVLDLASGQRYQITNSQYGAYNPEVNLQDNLLYFNDFQEKGMNVVKIPLDKSAWVPIVEVKIADEYYFEPLISQKEDSEEENYEKQEYPVKRYHSIANIINIHSWGPLASSDLNTAQLAVFSDDVLRTTGITAGYEYNINDRNGNWFADISYQGLFPILDFRIEKGSRTDSFYFYEDIKNEWEETTTYFGSRIPLQLTRSKFYSNLELGYNVGIRNINDFNGSFESEIFTDKERIAPGPGNDSVVYLLPTKVEEGTLAFQNINFSYYLLQKQSARDLNSRWGFVTDVEKYGTINSFSNKYDGGLFAIRNTFYMPSPVFLIKNNIFKHHSLFVRLNYQKRKSHVAENLYYFSNRISLPRGFAHYNYTDFTSWSFNYKLPLLYPDLILGPFLYVKRVKLNLFYDYGSGNSSVYGFIKRQNGDVDMGIAMNDYKFSSVGAELTFDINVMRFPVDIDLGVRGVYTLEPTVSSSFDFLLLNINF